jgi:hypothetical protein
MRKIFLLLALALSVGANAQTKYSFDTSTMSESDLTITNGSYASNKIKADAGTLDPSDPEGKTVIPTEMTLKVKDYPITFTYNNTSTSGKDIFTNVFAKKYLQANGKNTSITITGLNEGDIIEVEYSGKSDAEEDIAGELTGLTADSKNETSINKAVITSKYYATASTATIKETSNGYLLYSISVIPSDYDPWADAFLVRAKTEMPLDQSTMDSNDWMNYISDGWSGEKTYGAFSGNFVNLSKAARNITLKFKGAKKFEVYVQNSNSGRSYDISVNGTSTTINHGATGIESSGIMDCDPDGTELKLAGNGSGSVYPVGIRFYTDEPTVSLSIPSCGLATLISDKNLDLANLPAGLKAYIITGYNEAKTALLVNELTSPVHAETGLLFEGESGNYELSFVDDAPELDVVNKLKGYALKFKDMDNDEKANVTFILNPSDGMFITCTGGMLPPGKCYVDLDPSEAVTASAKGMRIVFDNVVTGINEVETETIDNVMYNVNGIRVSNPAQHGIYIVNGKKVVK